MDLTKYLDRISVLRADVKNPKPNRSRTRDWRYSPVFRAGMGLVVVTKFHEKAGVHGIVRLGGYSHEWISVDSAQGLALLGSMEPREPTNVREVVDLSESRMRSIRSHDILQYFIKAGALTLDEIIVAENELFRLEEIERRHDMLPPDHGAKAGLEYVNNLSGIPKL